MNLLVGTSGYSYKEWKGSFYPEKIPAKEMLSYYSDASEHGGDQCHFLSHAAEEHAGKLEGAGAAELSGSRSKPRNASPTSSD